MLADKDAVSSYRETLYLEGEFETFCTTSFNETGA